MTYFFPSPRGEALLSTQPFPNGNMIYATAMYEYLMGIGMPGLFEFEVKNGRLSRYPDRLEDTSIDDYLAATCDLGFALRFLGAGALYVSVMPGFSFNRLLGLMPSFWGVKLNAKLRAGKGLGPIDVLIWSIALLRAARQPKENQDGWVQSHLMILVWRQSKMSDNVLMRQAVAYWKSKQPQSTWRTMADYIGTESHPLVDAWRLYE